MTSLFQVRRATIEGRLEPTNIAIEAGQMIAVVGPNGGGKTSLLRACAAIDGTAASIVVGDEDLRAASPVRRGRLLGYLPASRELVWPMAVRDVVALGLPTADPRRVDELIATLEMEVLANRAVDRLSTGERTRVLLARALAPRPQVLLLDEPLSNLDPYWVLRLLQLLREVANGGATVIVVLHDIERMSSFDRVLLVSNGKICADLGPAAMRAEPEFARAFRIETAGAGWQLSPLADPRSSP